MQSNLEARKLSIVECLVELEDEAVIQQIERLLKPKIDFWEELTEKQKESLKRGLSQLKAGNRKPYSEVLAKYRVRKTTEA
jgi:hypothetical protein